jgi:hypothetical protein
MHRTRVVTLVWLTIASAGCGRDERAPSPPPVVATRDFIITSTALVTTDTTATTRRDTGRIAGERWHDPKDCRFTDGRPRPDINDPGYGERYDSAVMARGIPFRCRLRPDGPEVRLLLRGEWSIPTTVEVFSPPGASRPLQTLTLDHDQSAYEGNELLVGEDLNGDGWMDLRVNTWYGSAGQMSEVFRFDPSSRRFVADTALPGMNVHRLAGRPCVGTSTKSGAWDYSTAEYCWSGGTWVQTRTFRQELLRDGGDLRDKRVIRTLGERRGGRMQVVRMDTVPENAPEW